MMLRLMTKVEKLGIGQDPRGPSGVPLRVKGLTEIGRRARAPQVVFALREMMKSRSLSFLLLAGVNLLPDDLTQCTGLKDLFLVESDLYDTRSLE